jgi:hypothetical protein
MYDDWMLEVAWTVTCVHCYHKEDVFKSNQEEVIRVLQGLKWHLHENGPWCPECSQLLDSRYSFKNLAGFKVGDAVADYQNRPIGTIVHMGKGGYANVKMPDGFVTPFALCELEKVK